ncbi:MAG: aminopeptidase [Desulfuromonadales bacterium]
MKRLSVFLLLLIIGILLLNGCSDNTYLWQSVKGHWSLMSRARPITDILAQEKEPQNVRNQLTKVVHLREFAVNTLHLPDSGSYQNYADIERPYAVWNLVVAPELSLELNQWCFPIAGCVTYRGYFDKDSALMLANHFSVQGFEVDVYGVQAYSTLNWFDDPVLNTFLSSDDLHLAALLFHEMAHQVIYVQNDTAFNEAFAKTVEREGLRRWLQNSGTSELWQQYLQREAHAVAFNGLLTKIRGQLRRIYDADIDNDQKRLAKKQILEHALADYEDLKQSWNGYTGYDAWIQRGLNNARLSSVAAYYDLVPAFESLLAHVNGDLQKFYAEVKILGGLPKTERLARLNSLSPSIRAGLD